MGNLVPKNDYFKHTTRTILTEQEKQETIAMIIRASSRLSELSSITRFEVVTSRSGRTVMRNMSNWSKFSGRNVSLLKGLTQPRHLYRRERRSEIAIETSRIAKETGADYDDVQKLFTTLMNPYVGEQP